MENKIKQALYTDSSHNLELQKKRLKDSCRQFESVMVSYMMKTMREGVSWGEEHDNAREIYQDMFAEQVSKEIGRSSALGIGDMLYSKLEQLLKKPLNKTKDSTDS